MEFGKVDPAALPGIDFTLPADGPFTQQQLPGKPARSLNVYVGGAKWGRKEWIGVIYPKGTKESAFLDHYVRHFNSIELNATHYKIYSPAVIGKWAAKAAGRDFKFCPKVPQSISHYTDLGSERARQLTDEFLAGVHAFGNTLGPIFLQLSEKYTPQRKEQLLSYLAQLPRDVPFFLEVRHESWFSDAAERAWLLTHVQQLGIGMVITDTSARRDCVHMELTTDTAFVRFVGNGLHPTDYTRIDAWVERLADWQRKGLREVYFFMHQHDEIDTIELCADFIRKMNEKCGLNIALPNFVNPQQSLF